ncbi:MAG: UDP-N-acetylglucosamine 4,6-dehydratase (inverting) [Cyclobacteriaceae bacterium]
MLDLNNKRVLLIGGTGSFGKAFTQEVISRFPKIKRLAIYSRDELKQFEMAQQWPIDDYPFMRYFIGDVRDASRLKRACENIDIIVHAAALKQVPTAEYNPFECIKTNVLGAQNVIEAALDSSSVRDVVALSTDKAAAPINLYGATKLCSDKLFIAANNIRGLRDLKFSVVRYGNVMGSRGSVMPFFLNLRASGVLPITDENMTRFNISLKEGVEMVLKALEIAKGGEVFVPKIPSYKITDVAKAIGPNCNQKIVGIRPGEKLHEEMITESDSHNTIDIGDYYAILPQSGKYTADDYIVELGARKVEPGFRYNSGTNSSWLSVEEIRELILTHIDSNFSV